MLKFGGFITNWNFEAINPCNVRNFVHKGRININYILIFGGPFDKFLQLIKQDLFFRRNYHRSGRWCLFHRKSNLLNFWTLSMHMIEFPFVMMYILSINLSIWAFWLCIYLVKPSITFIRFVNYSFINEASVAITFMIVGDIGEWNWLLHKSFFEGLNLIVQVERIHYFNHHLTF